MSAISSANALIIKLELYTEEEGREDRVIAEEELKAWRKDDEKA